MRCCFIENRDTIAVEKKVGYCNRIMEYLDRYEHNKDSLVWDTLTEDIPQLKAVCSTLLEKK